MRCCIERTEKEPANLQATSEGLLGVPRGVKLELELFGNFGKDDSREIGYSILRELLAMIQKQRVIVRDCFATQVAVGDRRDHPRGH